MDIVFHSSQADDLREALRLAMGSAFHDRAKALRETLDRQAGPTLKDDLRQLSLLADQLHLQSSDLDETVHQIHSSMASDINNLGREEQLCFILYSSGGLENAKNEIKHIEPESDAPGM